jgi:hypothetical protein
MIVEREEGNLLSTPSGVAMGYKCYVRGVVVPRRRLSDLDPVPIAWGLSIE